MSSLGLCLCPGELTSDTNDLQGNDQTARLIEILTQLTSTVLFFFLMWPMVQDYLLSHIPIVCFTLVARLIYSTVLLFKEINCWPIPSHLYPYLHKK